MNNDAQYESLNRSQFEEFQRQLIFKQGSPEIGSIAQLDFLERVVEGGKQFSEYIKNEVGVLPGKSAPLPSVAWTDRELHNMPWHTEKEVFDIFSDLALSQASCPETWARAILDFIQHDRFECAFLAWQSSIDGKSRIHKALKNSDDTEINACVRAVFRRMGGVYRDRGKRSAFIDCPIARAWWRHYYARETRQFFVQDEVEAISSSLRDSNIWEELIQAMVSRLTVIGAISIRAALIHLLSTREQLKHQVREIFNAVGRRCAVQAMPVLSAPLVLQIIETEILATLESSSEVENNIAE